MQRDLSAGKQKLTVISGVVCRLLRELGACTNSVYQALFPPPPHKSLGTRLGMSMFTVIPLGSSHVGKIFLP